MSRLTQAIRAGALGPAATEESLTIGRHFRFDADFPGFAGHFPGFPILPAVAQVQTGLVMAEDHLGMSLSLRALENAKFLAQINPGDEITVWLREKSRDGRLRFDVRILRGEELVSAFLLELARKEGA